MRTRPLRRIVAALATATLAAGTLVGLSTGARAASPGQDSIATLMRSYDPGTGLIGGGWWTSAVMLSTVLTYRQATGDTQYDAVISNNFEKQKGNSFENEYLDDVGWWANAWVQAYDVTGDKKYLDMAEHDAQYIHRYWDDTCGGGVWWSTAKTYKAAIANELFLQLTASLHNRIPGDTTYLDQAKAEWAWFQGTGMINGSSTINDGIDLSTCKNNNDTVWTYNQGVILSGLTELAYATGDATILPRARAIADAAISRLSTNGILTEPCEPDCGLDGPTFKGPFVRGVRTLATALRTTSYDGWLTAQATSIVANDTNGSGQQGLSWAGPIRGLTASAQGAAAAALVAAENPTGSVATRELKGKQSGRCVTVPGFKHSESTVVTVQDCFGGTSQAWAPSSAQELKVYGNRCLDVRGGGAADGTAVQIFGCNGSAAQKWTVRADGTVLNPSSGKCLDARAQGNGTELRLWACAGTDNQVWAPVAQPTGGVLRGAESNRCVDIPDSSTASGTALTLWDCNGSGAQKWVVGANGSLVNPNGKCLDVDHGSATDGTTVQLWDCNGSGAQQWTVRSDGAVVNAPTGKCLEAAGHGTANRTRLQVWSCTGGANQKWSRT